MLETLPCLRRAVLWVPLLLWAAPAFALAVPQERDLPDNAIGRKWYAPGVGLVKDKGKGEVLKLFASSLLPLEE